MSEVLSQNEIDSLLAALDSGELEVDDLKENQGPQVKNYDFKRPAKFSKEHLRTLEIIFEHYGRLLSTNLPVYLRKNVQVSVASSETVTFAEFSNALSLCKSLIKVVLREDRINDIGVDLICKKIQLLPMLQILDLGNNTMTILGAQMIKCFNQLYQNKRNVYINYRYKMHQISLRLTNIIKERFLI